MKVVALFQIYLPYFLPRTPEWSMPENLQLQFEVEGHLVNVHPRKQDEKMFPRPIDEELSGSTLDVASDYIVPVEAPTHTLIRDLCYDRLEVQVHGEVAAPEECMTPDTVWKFLGRAVSASNNFLYNCRVAGRDPSISALSWNYSFNERTYYFSNPYTVTWYGEDDGQPLYDDKKQLMHAATVSIRSPERKPVPLDSIERSIRLGIQPNLPASLLVNAQERIIAGQLREGVIDLASACEIAATQYIERKGMSGDTEVRRILADKWNHSFAERNYHLVPTHIEGKSLQADDPTNYNLLEKAYKTRNSLAHSGELTYKDSGTVVVVTRQMVNDFFRACERGVEWIMAL